MPYHTGLATETSMGGDTYEIEVTATYSNGTTIKDTFDLKVVTASLDTEIFDALNMLEEKGADLIQMDDSGVAINEIMMMAKADEVNLIIRLSLRIMNFSKLFLCLTPTRLFNLDIEE